MEETVSFPYEINFTDFEATDSVRPDVEKYLRKLERITDRIVSCHVTIRAPQIRKRKHPYEVHIIVKVPGNDIVVTHEHAKDFSHTNIRVALKDAFDIAIRQLKKHMDQMQSPRRTTKIISPSKTETT